MIKKEIQIEKTELEQRAKQNSLAWEIIRHAGKQVKFWHAVSLSLACTNIITILTFIIIYMSKG